MSRNSSVRNMTCPLDPEGIDRIAEQMEAECERLGTDRKSMTRCRLAAEESAAIWMKELGEDREIFFEAGRKLTRPYFQISVEGERCNPYGTVTEQFGDNGNSMLLRLGLVPTYTYVRGRNVLTFNVAKKEMNQLLVFLLVIVSAIVVSFLGKEFLPASVITYMCESIIVPIEDAFFSVLSCIAGPMIFLSVVWGVYGIGDVYTLGVVGKKLMLFFLGVVYLATCAAAFLYPFLGPEFSDRAGGGFQIGDLLQILLAVFPSNFISPFIDGNTLQIIVLAFVIGLCMIYLGQRTSSIARAVEQINYMVTLLMKVVSKMVPYFVFIVLVEIFWSDSLDIFQNVARFTLVFLGASFGFLLCFIVYVSIRRRQSPVFLVKTLIPSYLIALTTASSAAAFESNMTISRKMGIRNAFASFGIPLGQVMFKPNTAMYYLLLCFYFAQNYQVAVSFDWILIAVVISGMLAVATPPIPGGAAATYTILFTQLGIPTEAMAVAMAVDMIFDFMLTSGDTIALLLGNYEMSCALGMQEKGN